ncbi:ribonucleases P/MRP protein subunit POP1-like [Asterias amurensis]|uniref:ribonucleases P/MRP protein subunit POP1-like n=1 Tax=Asterias amurensis TaxID=7602 RepID=UPI003AB4335F
MEKEKDENKDEGDILAHNPRAINVAEFAGARAAELKTMTEAVMTMGGTRRTFQKLPRHLRRRAMSHDLRRLPKRLRESEERAMNKGASKKTGRGKEGDGETSAPAKRSRRHRRRPSNLREEYQRRQRSHTWLETHIWHAKRFKMAELWGHRLPLHPSDKSVRATYRALVKHCLIQDISYMKVIEVSGQQGCILKALSHLTSPSTGLTCAAASYLSGQRHGDIVLYKYDQFPEGALGPVNFLWRAEGGSKSSSKLEESTTVDQEGMSSVRKADKFEDSSVRQLWVWAHPACTEVLVKELQTACENENKNADDKCNGITVKLLEDSPLRFRLQGPLCHPVLLDTLKIADTSATPDSTSSNQPKRWWETYYSNPDKVHIQSEQSSTWNTLHGIQKTAVLPPRCVLGLTVRDPRNLLPIKKRKVMPDPEEFVANDCLPVNTLHGFPASVSVSPIWDESVQKAVKSTQVPVHKLNKMRAELLVPGTELSLGREESRIPVLLLQYPGVTHSAGMATTTSSKQQGVSELGSGWDLILPSGWGMAFWVALIYRGARASGLLQSRSCALQQGFHHFPQGYPDTTAGREHEEAEAKELTKKFKRWPPAKRPNYGKLGVVSPFQCPWEELLNEWRDAKLRVTEAEEEHESEVKPPLEGMNEAKELVSNTELPFFVLREKFKLESLNKFLVANQWPPRVSKDAKSTNQIFQPAGGAIVDASMVASNGHAEKIKGSPRCHPESSLSEFMSGLQENSDKTLVGVKLCMVNRGVPTPYAMICLPSASDLAAFSSDPNHCPIEPIHKECILPRTTKKEKKKKRKNKSKDELQEPLEIFPKKKLLDSSIRRIIGFVTDGAHTFVSGSGRGVGYCCMLGLMALLEEHPPGQRALVLVRDTKTVQYRFAYLGVVT